MARQAHDPAVRVPADGAPTLSITLADGAVDLAERLRAADGGQLPARNMEVTYRETDGDRPGVLAIANRLTGDFVLETPLGRDRVRALVEAVRDRPDGEYWLELVDGDRRATFEMDALLVYDDTGTLLAGQSLVPGGVEL